jgi:hypothetical protein
MAEVTRISISDHRTAYRVKFSEKKIYRVYCYPKSEHIWVEAWASGKNISRTIGVKLFPRIREALSLAKVQYTVITRPQIGESHKRYYSSDITGADICCEQIENATHFTSAGEAMRKLEILCKEWPSGHFDTVALSRLSDER